MMENMYWTFSKKRYADVDEFTSDLKKYREDLIQRGASEATFAPEEKVVGGAEVNLVYEAWIASKDDLLENETLCEDDEDLDEDEKEDGMWQVEIVAHLRADDGSCFTAAELLMKAHNQQANKELGDHVFFEGFEDTDRIDGIPSYYIICGS